MSRRTRHPHDGYTPASTGLRRLPWVAPPTWWPRREHTSTHHRSLAAYARLEEVAESTEHEGLRNLARRQAGAAAWDLRQMGVRGDIGRLIVRDGTPS